MQEAPAAAPAAPAASSSDVGADLSAAFDAAETPDSPDSSATSKPSSSAPSAPSPSAKSSPSAPSSPGATAGNGAGPARNADGTFAKGDAAPAAPATPADPKAAPANTAAGELKLPEKWPADIKAKFEALHKVSPEHAQFALEQFNLARSQFGELEKRKQSFAQQQKVFESVEQLLAPGRQTRALKGIDDGSYVRNLIAAGEFLEKNPQDGLRWLAKNYGIDLQQLANPETRGEEPPPYVRQLQEEVAQTRGLLQSFAGQQEQAQLRAVSQSLEQFALQKDEAGQPKYPHFDELLPEIIVNVQYQKNLGHPVDLHAAYTRAERMNDTVWQRRQLAQAEADRKTAAERQRKEAEEARRAGFSVSGSGGGSSDIPADSLRGELERQFDR